MTNAKGGENPGWKRTTLGNLDFILLPINHHFRFVDRLPIFLFLLDFNNLATP
jgi:hypothetical protein